MGSGVQGRYATLREYCTVHMCVWQVSRWYTVVCTLNSFTARVGRLHCPSSACWDLYRCAA